MKDPTPFIEANALLALQRDDHEEAVRQVEQLLPGERAGLAHSCSNLANICHRVAARERAR